MVRNWLGIAISVAVALAMFAGAVLYAVHQSARPRGFSGLQFSSLTPAASARTPLLPKGGALVSDVMPGSPAARAGILSGTVVAAIDGTRILSARQASDLVRTIKAQDRAALMLYDVTKGDIHPREVTLVFDAAPVLKKTLSVRPPRTLAEEEFERPSMVANAAWSRRIALGAFIKPLALKGIGDGRCNGFVPERWSVRGHAADNSMFHVAADSGFAHAIFKSGALEGKSPQDHIAAFLETTFGSPAILAAAQPRPFGFTLHNFGNRKGGAGFVLYRATGGRIAFWLAAMPAGDAGWARPLIGSAVLSMRCAAPGAPKPVPRAAGMPATTISARCIAGMCEEGDFAGSYMTMLRKGYVHNGNGAVFLVNPRKDLWQNGARGPGYYHQVQGDNEKLEPGRTN